MVMKMHSFRNFLLDHEYFVSRKLFVPFHNDFKHHNVKIRIKKKKKKKKKKTLENINLPSMRVLNKLNARLYQENISPTFKHLQNICEKPLSDTRKHTLVITVFVLISYMLQ